ncbi:MAG: SDR family NAD(P)-dependent oxidoreductase [Comamonadaceae bacterium]|nr:SDR family NAD(P)-dependent oxidoreductase [Comamonadaceae bacterium]
MDLHISNRSALLCGASKGLGRACAERLAAEGVHITLSAREESRLQQACEEIRQRHAVRANYIVADMSTPQGRAAILSGCPAPDILVLCGGWPEVPATTGAWPAEAWRAAIDAMLLAQVEMISTLSQGMVKREFGRIVAVTSRLIKDPELRLAMPAAARLGLTGYIKALSRDIAVHNVTVNSILPGIFETETQIANTNQLMAMAGASRQEIVAQRTTATPAGRFGSPDEFSALCAYLCSRDAGFMTGQAVVIDGGAHTGIW